MATYTAETSIYTEVISNIFCCGISMMVYMFLFPMLFARFNSPTNSNTYSHWKTHACPTNVIVRYWCGLREARKFYEIRYIHKYVEKVGATKGQLYPTFLVLFWCCVGSVLVCLVLLWFCSGLFGGNSIPDVS